MAITIGSALRGAWRWLKISAVASIVLCTVAIAIIYWMWRDRPDLAALDWPIASASTETIEGVTVTWLGVTTLLFDDSETQVLIDGFFTRFGPVDFLVNEVRTDIANVNYAMAEFRINRLAAVVPVHSHFDHAMDVGIVANRSSAVVLGSESTANIARGANLPVNQYQILADGESRTFGNFTITLLVSEHAPVADGTRPWFPGEIRRPLLQPARVSDWKEGETYSILITHPRGTALIQGSAGFIPKRLDGVSADVVLLGVGGLSGLGEEYARQYWAETVTATAATRVFPIHYDDFTAPFGEIETFPAIIDDVVKTADWLNEIAVFAEPQVQIQRLPFGQRVTIY